jgi:hypothetical protein
VFDGICAATVCRVMNAMSTKRKKVTATTYRAATLGVPSCLVEVAPTKLHLARFMYTAHPSAGAFRSERGR